MTSPPASPSRQSHQLSSRTHSAPSPKSSSEILSSTRLPLSADRSTLAMPLFLCLPTAALSSSTTLATPSSEVPKS
jgi:hypothetical protein